MSKKAEQFLPNDIYDDGSAIKFANAFPDNIAAVLPQAIEKQKREIYKIETPLIEKLYETRPQFDPAQFVTDLKLATNFREVEGKYRLRRFIPISIYRYKDKGEPEAYKDKVAKEKQRGKENAAAYGNAELNNRDFVLFTTHWDHFYGTLDVDMGERFVRAAAMARERNVPLVAFFASAGARQQEGTPGLKQMPRMVEAIRKFKEETKMPYISIIGESWGGITASAATLGDVVIGMRGSGMGFAGPRVIEEATQKKVKAWEQSVEQNFLDGNIDMIMNDKEEVLQWLDGMLEVAQLTKRRRGKFPEGIDLSARKPSHFDQFPFGGEIRIINRLSHPDDVRKQDATVPITVAIEDDNIEYPEDSYVQYEDLLYNAKRPDTEFFMQSAFDKFIPLYSSVADGKNLHHKGMIAGYGIMGGQVFLVTGNQRGYYQGNDGQPRVIQGQLGAKDLQRRKRILVSGARMGCPLVTMVHTFGARPAIEEERNGLSEAIATATMEGQKYPHPSLTYVIGPYGSGGGIGSGQFGEEFVMFSGSHVYVAPPRSFTSILYNTMDPARELIIKATHEAHVTAKDQLELQLIDGVIPEPSGGADKDPLTTASRLRSHIVHSLVKHSEGSIKDRLHTRSRKILEKRGGTIVELHE